MLRARGFYICTFQSVFRMVRGYLNATVVNPISILLSPVHLRLYVCSGVDSGLAGPCSQLDFGLAAPTLGMPSEHRSERYKITVMFADEVMAVIEARPLSCHGIMSGV